jgi:hypothetical protein
MRRESNRSPRGSSGAAAPDRRRRSAPRRRPAVAEARSAGGAPRTRPAAGAAPHRSPPFPLRTAGTGCAGTRGKPARRRRRPGQDRRSARQGVPGPAVDRARPAPGHGSTPAVRLSATPSKPSACGARAVAPAGSCSAWRASPRRNAATRCPLVSALSGTAVARSTALVDRPARGTCTTSCSKRSGKYKFRTAGCCRRRPSRPARGPRCGRPGSPRPARRPARWQGRTRPGSGRSGAASDGRADRRRGLSSAPPARRCCAPSARGTVGRS